MSSDKAPKIALVHDFLLTFGGAERVFQVMTQMYPEAPIYTLLADPKIVERSFPGRAVHTSFLQHFPTFLRRHYQWLLPFYPVATEMFDLRDYDVVLSSSGAWTKGIITRLYTKHIAYLHSPMRFAWEGGLTSFTGKKTKTQTPNFFVRAYLTYLRLWDRMAAERPDVLLANSSYTASRIEKYYRRQAEVIYPSLPSLPRLQFVQPPKREHFLVVARLTQSKNIDQVIEAFNKLDLPLVIVGEGKERKQLQKRAGKNVTFTGAVSDSDLADLYMRSRALIEPSKEDFGLVAIEALSYGTPVIAFGTGGVREILQPGVTGEFFDSLSPEILADGIRRFLEHEQGFDRDKMLHTAKQFSREQFEGKIRQVVQQTLSGISL